MEAAEFAQLLKRIREHRQITQEDLARELEVTVGTLSNWENARHRPVRAQRRRIEQIAESMGLLDSAVLERKAP